MMLRGAFLLKLCAVKGFGNKLKAMRKARGWSQPQAAEHLGVTAQTISTLELGKTEPSLETFLAVMDEFGVSAEFLRSEPEEDPGRAETVAAITSILGRMDIETLIASRDILKVLARTWNR